MRTIAFVLASLATLAVYLVWVRPYLKTLPTFKEAFEYQDTYWAGFKEWFRGRKTVLTGIWGSFVGLLPEVLQHLQLVDLKTMFNLPDQWALFISIGTIVLMTYFRTAASPPEDA